jgi:hypothetical protein
MRGRAGWLDHRVKAVFQPLRLGMRSEGGAQKPLWILSFFEAHSVAFRGEADKLRLIKENLR